MTSSKRELIDSEHSGSKPKRINSRSKGFGFERFLVNLFKSKGFGARRAWGSDGRSIGWAKEVDVELKDHKNYFLRIQAKRIAKLPKLFEIPDGVDIVVAKQDRGEIVFIASLEFLISLLNDQKKDAES